MDTTVAVAERDTDTSLKTDIERELEAEARGEQQSADRVMMFSQVQADRAPRSTDR
jgi:hypothetical protein